MAAPQIQKLEEIIVSSGGKIANIVNKNTTALIVKDYNTNQRKYLYEILVEKGFSKTYLQRLSTTHLQ
jgi:hypothetical protein